MTLCVFSQRLNSCQPGKGCKLFFLFASILLLSCAQIQQGTVQEQNITSLTAQNQSSAQLKPELVVQLAHDQPILAMSLSGNGQYLATASWDKTIRLWNTSTGQQIRQLRQKSNSGLIQTDALVLSYNGDQLLSGGKDATIYQWSTNTGKVIAQHSGHTAAISSIALSPDETFFISGGHDNSIKKWPLNSSKNIPATNIASLPGNIVALDFTSDGKSIIAASFTSAWLIDPAGRNSPKSFASHPAGISVLAISKDDQYVLTGDIEKNIWLSKISNQKKIRSYTGHTEEIFSLDFFPDGQGFVSSSQDSSIRFWDLASSQSKKDIVLDEKSFVRGIRAIDKSTILYSQGTQINLYDHRNDKNVVEFVKNVGWASAVKAANNGHYLLIGSWDHTAYLWDLRSGIMLHHLKGHQNHVRAVAFSADNKLAVTADRNGVALLWDVSSGARLQKIYRSDSGIKTVAFSPDGSGLVIGNDAGNLWFESFETFETSKETKLSTMLWTVQHQKGVYDVAFSPDGQYVLSSSNFFSQEGQYGLNSPYSEQYLWDAANGTLLQTFKVHGSDVQSIDISHDGRYFASSGSDKQILIRNLPSGKIHSKWTNKGGIIYALRFSPDGRYLATAGEDELIHLWDINNNTLLKTFKGSASLIIDLAFSSDGAYLFSSGADQMTQIWQVSSAKHLAAIVGFNNSQWAVVDRQGRYDAANGGDIVNLHWVIGKETIKLSQLKQRYYEPGLLAKVLGNNQEPLRNIHAFSQPLLFPEVSSYWDAENKNLLHIRLKDRGGGIGKVTIHVNGKEVVDDARDLEKINAEGLMMLSYDLSNHPFLLPGEDNSIAVFAYNSENYLTSRGVKQIFSVAQTEQKTPETLWAIVAGISDYHGQRIDLRYAAKDALDFKTALTIGAKKLFGSESVNIKLLTTENDLESIRPDKQAFIEAFSELKNAKPWDILVIYLAGHGLSFKDEYYYLTADAGTIELSDPEIVQHLMISGSELTQWLKQTPIQKQVLLLDTCAAGSIASSFFETRDISSSQIRAIEQMKDRTGLHVLMGSAANAVSYEATHFEQGLMTYALLQGVKGAALKENELVDVSKLLQYVADTVPELAAQIGGVQRPRLASPAFAESFSIGSVDKSARALIPLAIKKPVLLKPVFLNQESLLDDLNISSNLRRYLREQNYKKHKNENFNVAGADIAYMDSEQFPAAISVSGVYKKQQNTVFIHFSLGQDNKIIMSKKMTINTAALVDDKSIELSTIVIAKLATEIYKAINQNIKNR